MDLNRLVDFFYQTWVSDIEHSKQYMKDFPLAIEREGLVIKGNMSGKSYYAGFSKTTPEEQREAIESQKPSKQDIVVPKIAFFAFSPEIPAELRGDINSQFSTDSLKVRSHVSCYAKFDNPSIEFFNYAGGLSEIMRARVGTHMADTFNDDKTGKKVFDGMFYPVNLRCGRLTYENEQHAGVFVRSPIRKIPTGEQGGLSSDLYKYGKRGIIGPLYKAVIENR